MKKLLCLTLITVIMMTSSAFALPSEPTFFETSSLSNLRETTDEWLSTASNRAFAAVLLVMDFINFMGEEEAFEFSFSDGIYIGKSTGGNMYAAFHNPKGTKILMLAYDPISDTAQYWSMPGQGSLLTAAAMESACVYHYEIPYDHFNQALNIIIEAIGM